MTEQQILDKTIEYLNKHSNCFKNWRFDYYMSQESIFCTHYAVEMSCGIKDALLEDYLNPKYNDVMISVKSEFRIAYNIIKDLAQNGPNALR